MSAKSFIYLLSIIFVSGLFLLIVYNLVGSGTGVEFVIHKL
jgi:hypothetical protein